MGTTIRPELSEKNPYWIERHRYYELKHFCLQYPIWKKAYAALDGLSRRPSDLEVFSKKGEISDPKQSIDFQTICSDIFKASGDNADDQSDKSDDCILDCVEDPYIFKRGHAFVLDD